MKVRGFSLVEMLISVAVISCLVLVLTFFSQNAFRIFANMEKTKSIAEVMEQLRFTLAVGEQCSLNFKDLPLSVADTAGVPLQSISTFDNNTKLKNSDIVVVSAGSNLTSAQSILLIPQSQLNIGLISANLQVAFQAGNNANVPAILRSLPILVRVQGGKVQECWVKRDSSHVAGGLLCQALTAQALNSVGSTQCELRNGRWFIGTSTQASCPAGALLPAQANSDANCAVDMPSSFVDTFPKSNISVVSGGGTDQWPMARSPVLLSLDAPSSTCYCDAAADLSSAVRATFACKILCLVP
ncbi:MAG TPA: prepilin-type N-terminal cleavage/methylation domain-containing protein [Pseudobdellovibrionaceae bacterium]|jgi:prepilin-type N-terminal cleavage/methylation domain-containing protein